MDSPLRSLLDRTASVAIILLSGAMIYSLVSARGTPRPPARSQVEALPADGPTINVRHAPVKGSPTAPVAIVEFSDFQCPYCAKVTNDVLPRLAGRYVETGVVQVVFANLPLGRIHPFASRAAVAALCAHDQDRFWPLHDLFFSRQDELNESALVPWAQQAGLQMADFVACLAAVPSERLAADAKLAELFGVTGTPAFIVGQFLGVNEGVKPVLLLRGAVAADVLMRAVEDVLAK